jgi:hypothetical protein
LSDGRSDLVDQLGKLASLRDSGALTQAEFETAKARVLGTVLAEPTQPGHGAARKAEPAPRVFTAGPSPRLTSRSARAEHFDVNEEMTLAEVWPLLRKASQPAAELTRAVIPPYKGIYAWFSGPEVEYIGTATGAVGLRGRIGNHLAPRYLESRPEKLGPADEYQLSCGVFLNRKPAVDKSVFRRSLGRTLRISPGEGTVAYIRQLSVGWLTFSPAYEGTILSLEEALIQAVKPKLNVKGQNPNRYR